MPSRCYRVSPAYDRGQEHNSHRIALLEYLQSIPQNSPLNYWPSTSELQEMKIFGLRPVNRIGDLRDGKIEHYRFDVEKISCGHGVNRWRLHWPNRPGYPKPKSQTVLPLEPERAKRQASGDWFEREFGPRPELQPADDLPLFAGVRR
jgi:hypothetical protein